MLNSMMDIYLDKESKAYYMTDFNQNVLGCSDDSWKLDEGLEPMLKTINRNAKVQTLYSQKHYPGKRDNTDENYIRFAFAQELEEKLLKDVVPRITSNYSLHLVNCVCSYQYIKASERFNHKKDHVTSSMGCRADKDYFRVNTIKISMTSYDYDRILKFWEDITSELSQLK
jgi:hypothetical protein